MMPVVRQPNENKVAHAMSTHHRLVSDGRLGSPWRHKVAIKDLFVDEASHEAIDALCKRAVKEITVVIKSEDLRRDANDSEREYFVSQLESVKDQFDALIGAGDDTLEEREKNFNYALSELYDVGDMKIELRDGKLQKFLWVN